MVSSAAFPAGRIVLVVAAAVDAVMFPTVVTVASVAATLSGIVVTSVVSMGSDLWTSTAWSDFPERLHEVAVTHISERLDRSDTARSLAPPSPGAT
ncbi:hypothetical protein F2Q68_00002170 [Brassica cretica]|uniref:Uncharacterized protein n=1 Tax=Brassica cretica TaxID=69181 RepID=A0A8S9JK56_BRACR|nr:hypothetical protein F2Q68_00002170 [Brassica cretica]